MQPINLANHDGSLEAQLIDLYRGQSFLLSRLGTSDPSQLVALVEGLQEQLVAIYSESDGALGRLPVCRPKTAG
ncbi:MAG TPA: hypothetical protein DIU15_05585 [Deltaproteobacteria bacterium]|nr:hypothetical protein [Deltaproteobacteria bacterium]HCP45490.1 hypothetical protein [Deltaproteobacteria bacterium]